MPIGHILLLLTSLTRIRMLSLRRVRQWRHSLCKSKRGRRCFCSRRILAVHGPYALVETIAPFHFETAGASAVNKTCERVAASGAANPRLLNREVMSRQQ